MDNYDRLEPEEEAHRTQKALTEVVRGATLPLERGAVRVEVSERICAEPAAQHLVSLLVHLLLRMKGVVDSVAVVGLGEVERHLNVPLAGTTLAGSLDGVAKGLNGPESLYQSVLDLAPGGSPADVVVVVGEGDGDIRVGADAWRVLFGDFVSQARWQDVSPLGPYMAAAMAAAEVFKHLLHVNFGWTEGRFIKDLAFSLFNHGTNSDAAIGSDVSELSLSGAAIAGAGAGGTAVLYTLGSFSHLKGELLLAEPGTFKPSNLNRYLLSTYDEVHTGASKLESAVAFLRSVAPNLQVRGVPEEWKNVVAGDLSLIVSTVDTPEARWQVQRTTRSPILDGGVMMGSVYAVLRVVPGGWCLECKHPPDPEITWRKRASMWGLSVDEVKEWTRAKRRVARADIRRLADVQGRPLSDFAELEGRPFDELPPITECGETPLLLKVPAQAPVLPFATTAAGVMIAAEMVKEMVGIGTPLYNYFAHDLRQLPPKRLLSFLRQKDECRSQAHERSLPN